MAGARARLPQSMMQSPAGAVAALLCALTSASGAPSSMNLLNLLPAAPLGQQLYRNRSLVTCASSARSCSQPTT